jgi:hypothetical protein
MRVVVTRIEQDGTMQRRMVDTAHCGDGPRWEDLACRVLAAAPPPYRPVPGSPICHLSMDDGEQVLVAERDLGDALLDLVTAVLAMGEQVEHARPAAVPRFAGRRAVAVTGASGPPGWRELELGAPTIARLGMARLKCPRVALDALAFAGGRLDADRVVLLVGARGQAPPEPGDAREVLRDHPQARTAVRCRPAEIDVAGGRVCQEVEGAEVPLRGAHQCLRVHAERRRGQRPRPWVLPRDRLPHHGPAALKIITIAQADSAPSTFVHIPSLDAVVVGGDGGYDGIHQFLAFTDHDKRLQWIASVEQVEQLNPRIVIAGHKDADTRDNNPATIPEAPRPTSATLTRRSPQNRPAQGLVDTKMDLHGELGNPYTLWTSAQVMFEQGQAGRHGGTAGMGRRLAGDRACLRPHQPCAYLVREGPSGRLRSG